MVGRRAAERGQARGALFGLLLAALPAAVRAHDDGPLELHNLVRTWNWSPLLLLGLGLSGWLYWRGVRTIWRRAGVGRGVRTWQVAAFGAGLVALAAALVSPLAALGQGFFSAHMARQLLLSLVAAPLLLAGRPLAALAAGLPRWLQRSLTHWWRGAIGWRMAWRLVNHPLVAVALYGGLVVAWHSPDLYTAARATGWLQTVEAGSVLLAALLVWRGLIQGAVYRRRDYARALGVLGLLVTPPALLGALLLGARRLWHPPQAAPAIVWRVIHPPDEQAAAATFVCQPIDALLLNSALLTDLRLAGAIGLTVTGACTGATVLALLAAWRKTRRRAGLGGLARAASMRREPHHP